MASIDKRGRTWRARIRLQGFPKKTRSFDTRRAAEVWAKREEDAMLAGVESVPDLSTERTLAEALDKYKAEETVNKKGIVQETRRIEAFEEASARRAEAVAPATTALRRVPKGPPQKVAKNTVRLDLALIRNLFNIAMGYALPGKSGFLAWPLGHKRTRPPAGHQRAQADPVVQDMTNRESLNR